MWNDLWARIGYINYNSFYILFCIGIVGGFRMTEKRFIDGREECIEDQFLIDTSNDKYYFISKGLDDIIDLMNEQHETIKRLEFENFELKTKLNAIKSEFTHREILTIKEFEEVIK